MNSKALGSDTRDAPDAQEQVRCLSYDEPGGDTKKIAVHPCGLMEFHNHQSHLSQQNVSNSTTLPTPVEYQGHEKGCWATHAPSIDGACHPGEDLFAERLRCLRVDESDWAVVSRTCCDSCPHRSLLFTQVP